MRLGLAGELAIDGVGDALGRSQGMEQPLGGNWIKGDGGIAHGVEAIDGGQGRQIQHCTAGRAPMHQRLLRRLLRKPSLGWQHHGQQRLPAGLGEQGRPMAQRAEFGVVAIEMEGHHSPAAGQAHAVPPAVFIGAEAGAAVLVVGDSGQVGVEADQGVVLAARQPQAPGHGTAAAAGVDQHRGSLALAQPRGAQLPLAIQTADIQPPAALLQHRAGFEGGGPQAELKAAAI